jgi:hypothetical protein
LSSQKEISNDVPYHQLRLRRSAWRWACAATTLTNARKDPGYKGGGLKKLLVNGATETIAPSNVKSATDDFSKDMVEELRARKLL